MTVLLETQGLTVTFGGLAANRDVDLKVEQGAFVGLIGPNGAGKTTFIDAITGFVKPSAGVINFDGQVLNELSPTDRARLGLNRTFQSLELFEDLTVRDNLLVAAERPVWWSFLADIFHPGRRSAEMEQQVDWAIGVLGLEPVADRLPSDLSHGNRKLVGVARALAARPKLLLLDEPAAGLDTAESQALGAQLRDFLNRGITMFLIDHDMGLVLNVCDYIYVLDFGALIAQGTPSQIRRDPAVVTAYLGESAGEKQALEGSVVLEMEAAHSMTEAEVPVEQVSEYSGFEGEPSSEIEVD